MRVQDRRDLAVRSLITGVGVYLAMRFIVPHSLDSNMHSAVGGVVAFVISSVVMAIGNARKT